MMPIAPNFDVAHATATQPSSPPYTPTNMSPNTLRRTAPNGNLKAPRNITPLGDNKFSYFRADELSPQSSSDDDDEEEDDDDDDTIEDVGIVETEVDMAKIDVDEGDDGDDGEVDDDDDDDDDGNADEVEGMAESKQSSDSDDSDEEMPKVEVHATSISISMSVQCFTDIDIESCGSDYSTDEEDVILQPLQPPEYEYPPSDSSQSESLVRDMQHMSTFDSDESSEESSDDEFMASIKARRAHQRLRRMTSGSISKRTISERGSDTDEEDLRPLFSRDCLGPGIDNRRIRRKMDRHKMDRQSISMLHPHFESIREVNEDSDEDIDPTNLLNELPYWFMEVDE